MFNYRFLIALVLFLPLSFSLQAQDEFNDEYTSPSDSLLALGETTEWWTGHPADSLYCGIWDTEWINPYKVKIDSLPDTLHFNLHNYVHPLESTRTTSEFGPRRARFHYGLDIGLTVGDTIRSVFCGQVRICDWERKGYGRYVSVRHPNGLETVYAHMSKILVHIGDTLQAGQPVGLGGNSGRSTGPHLHFETRILGNAFNPRKIIDFQNRTVWQEDWTMVRTDTYDHKPILDELAKALYIKVRKGDTLSGLARKYGTSVRKLCQLNHIKENSIIRIGQQLRVR